MATIDDIKYDAQGLVPAVLIDCDTREVLMVAWMNAESLAITLETGLATFWSRIVLPAFGGETIIPLWPLPIGEKRSIILVEMSSFSVSKSSLSSG